MPDAGWTIGWPRMAFIALLAVLPAGGPLWAHDPVFGLGPHTLFKGGVEVHVGGARAEAGVDREQGYALALKYGITSDWAVSIEAPFVELSGLGQSRSGRGDIVLSTKYRFWREDTLGVQRSAALSVAVVPGGTGSGELANDGATDGIVGLSYGYEGRRWYRWAAVRYRGNGKNDAGLERGDKLLIDLVGGIRFRPTGYLEPDWVWMLELNGELAGRSRQNGVDIGNTGGDLWFVSPGLMWTYRNYAIKTGIQLPITQDPNGAQEEADYRFKLEFEGHF